MLQISQLDPSLERTFRGHRNYITSLSFSPKLKQLASGSGDNTIMLWNFKPQLRAFRFIGHKGVVTAVQFSPEGDVLASASKDKTVRLWIPSAKGESVVLKGHAGAVRSVDFSYDSRLLLTGSDDKTAKIWALPTRKFSCSLVGHSNWVRTACFNPDATLAATGSDDKLVKLWDFSTRQSLHSFYDHTDVVNCVAFHPEGNCLASGSSDKTLKMWDIRSHMLIQHYPAHEDAVTSLSIHSSGYYMLSSSKDSSLKIWDLREGRLLFTLQGHSGPVNAASFSKDGHFFASGGADQLAMVWKTNLVGVQAPVIEWGQGQKPRSVTTPTNLNTSHVIPSLNIRYLMTHRLFSAHISSSNKSSSPANKISSPLFASSKGLNPAITSSYEPVLKNRTTAAEVEAKTATNNSTNNQNNNNHKSNSSSLSSLPPALTNTLEHIIKQLDIITETMSLMDQRLTNTENKVNKMMLVQRDYNHNNSQNNINSNNNKIQTSNYSSIIPPPLPTMVNLNNQKSPYPPAIPYEQSHIGNIQQSQSFSQSQSSNNNTKSNQINYESSHIANTHLQSAASPPTVPVYFSKSNNNISNINDPIISTANPVSLEDQNLDGVRNAIRFYAGQSKQSNSTVIDNNTNNNIGMIPSSPSHSICLMSRMVVTNQLCSYIISASSAFCYIPDCP
eukprot:gene8808-11891_t